MKRIYLDYAAGTPVDKRVLKAMKRFLSVDFGNSGAIHKEGVVAKNTLEECRKKVASIFNSQTGEIVFTSGGTESNSLAIFGVVNNLITEGKKESDLHIITSKIEHASVIESFRDLESRGVKVDYISVNKDGLINLEDFKSKLTKDTNLVSFIYASNEIGVVQDVSSIAKIIRNVARKNNIEKKTVFHIDASQSPLYLSLNVVKLGVDLMTIGGQKIYGPKGVGALYIRRGVKIRPLFIGGSQERKIRPGTENIPLIVGLTKALELAEERREEEVKRLTEIRDYFINQILEKIPEAEINGSLTERLPNNVNVSFEGVNNPEFIVLQLDQKGIACSTKSACINEKGSLSNIVRALNKEGITNAFRFTLGRSTRKRYIDYVVRVLVGILK
ncbi:cysteine desulfurase family protein [Patescibacteria group bacterium]